MTNEQIIIEAAILIYGREAVMEMIASGADIPLHTISGWRSRGNYKVKKGEKGHQTKLWKKRKVNSEAGDPCEQFYMAKAFLFSGEQVELVEDDGERA